MHEARSPVQVALILEHEALKLLIGISKLEDLRYHEEVIPTLLESLKVQILTERLVKDPIIVDVSSLLILDGAHRAVALKSIGCGKVPCCFVDYDNEAIKLGTWYRCLSAQRSLAVLMEALRNLGLGYEVLSVPFEDVVGRRGLYLLSKEGVLEITPCQGEVEHCYSILSLIEGVLRREGIEVYYRTEAEAIKALREGLAEAVIAIPPLAKDEVRGLAEGGRLLPPKVTRHIIPARPLRLNVPLSMLGDEGVTLEDANRLLKKHLAGRKISRLGPGFTLEGRLYQEEVFYFSD